VQTPSTGCCGMAGIFGHETANQELSRSVFELSWADAVDSDSAVVATGYSCRSQTKRFAGRAITHPVHLL
jgi:Fe-S oxidoreductase